MRGREPVEIARSIYDLGQALQSGQTTSRQITEFFLARIEKHNPTLDAFLKVTAESALAEADAVDRCFAAGKVHSPLQGIPFGVKDIFDVAGHATTCQSFLTSPTPAMTDAPVVARLRKAGAVFLGKLATFEFSIGGPDFGLPQPPAKNPWNPLHVTGGSSTGAAGAVAAGLLPLAVGSDTGGSIRAPAAYCGVVGLKPTRGRISAAGMVPLSHSLDHPGPITTTVKDAALALDIMAAPLPSGGPHAFVKSLEAGVSGMRIGYARRLSAEHVDTSPELLRQLDCCADQLAAAGAEIEEVDFPEVADFDAAGWVTILYEAFAWHKASLRDQPEKYGSSAYQRLMAGARLSAEDYARAARLSENLRQKIETQVLGPRQALLLPSAFRTAPAFKDYGAKAIRFAGVMTLPFNVTGHPALSLPVALSENGLPLAVQLVAKINHEADLFRTGQIIEGHASYAKLRQHEARLPHRNSIFSTE